MAAHGRQPNNPPLGVANGKHNAVAKAVVGATLVILHHQACRDELRCLCA